MARLSVRALRWAYRHWQTVLAERVTLHSLVERGDAYLPQVSSEAAHIFVVAFNNAALIPVQHALVKRYVEEPHLYVVADNSTDIEASEFIRTYCSANGIGYIRLPRWPELHPSVSHGTALNWLMREVVAKRKPKIVGLLDHDIFPVGPFSARKSLGSCSFYGSIQTRGSIWYLWPGFSWFEPARVPLGKMDFRPGVISGQRVDTGGLNWSPIFSTLDLESEVNQATSTLIRLRDGEDAQDSFVERFDAWVHMINGSYWKAVAPKEQDLWKYLQPLVDVALPVTGS